MRLRRRTAERCHEERVRRLAGLNGRARKWTEEALRYDSSGQMMARALIEGTVIHGTRVPEGAPGSAATRRAGPRQAGVPGPGTTTGVHP
jgi:cytochrome P450